MMSERCGKLHYCIAARPDASELGLEPILGPGLMPPTHRHPMTPPKRRQYPDIFSSLQNVAGEPPPSGGRLDPLVRPESSPLHLLDHDIILRVRTDPEPYGCVVLNIAQGPPMNPDPDRIDRLA
jgi:hypothetical protein